MEKNRKCPNCDEVADMHLAFEVLLSRNLLDKSTLKAKQCDTDDCLVRYYSIGDRKYYWGEKEYDIKDWYYKGEDFKRA